MSKTRAVLSLTYNEIARRLLLKQEPSEIAQAMLIHEDQVKRAMLRPDFKEILQRLQDKMYSGVDRTLASDARNLREELQGAAFASFDRLVELQRTAASESVIVNISQDLLDRAGYGKTTKLVEEHTIRIDPLDAEVLTAALAREKEGRALMASKGLDELLKQGKAVPIGKHVIDDPSKPTT